MSQTNGDAPATLEIEDLHADVERGDLRGIDRRCVGEITRSWPELSKSPSAT
jgi:hypothetical protein